MKLDTGILLFDTFVRNYHTGKRKHYDNTLNGNPTIQCSILSKTVI